jgi:DNA-binding NtrC family response regulator
LRQTIPARAHRRVGEARRGITAESRFRPNLTGECRYAHQRAALRRRGDIPALAAWFLPEISRARPRPGAIDRSAIALLCAFPWRGTRASFVALPPAQRSDSDDGARRRAGGGTPTADRCNYATGRCASRSSSTRLRRGGAERHRGRIEAAAALGIQRTNLYRRWALSSSPPRAGVTAG